MQHWLSTSVRAGIRDRTDGYIVTEMSWPAFLYEQYTADQDNLEKGLFKSTLLLQVSYSWVARQSCNFLQVFKAIFTSPSFAREVTGDGDAANVIEAYRCTYKDFPSGKKVRTRGVCSQAQFMTPWVNPYPITPYWNYTTATCGFG